MQSGPVPRRYTRCLVAGGGPAGMMLGFLLARAGIEVTVLEKHGDFLRDFRGDTIHPSTLELMDELGLLLDFLDRPHTELRQVRMVVDGREFPVADFSRLPTICRFVAMMPQWDFLDFLAGAARAYPSFRLEMNTEVTDLLREGDRVTGVRARRADGSTVEISAELTVAADGRHSVLREKAMLPVRAWGVPLDVLWFRLPKHRDDVAAAQDAPAPAFAAEPEPALGYVRDRRMVITINRGDYWQTGVLIPKGGFDGIKAGGIDAFRRDVVEVVPFLDGPVAELDGFDEVSLLSVRVDRLRRWHRPGLLCIGDAAHAMSPAFGVGVNYAVQDAVATANALASRLLHGPVIEPDLHRIQRRREVPAAAMQAVQLALHRAMFATRGRSFPPASMPDALATAVNPALPVARRGMGRLIGLGFLPEHIRTPERDTTRR